MSSGWGPLGVWLFDVSWFVCILCMYLIRDSSLFYLACISVGSDSCFGAFIQLVRPLLSGAASACLATLRDAPTSVPTFPFSFLRACVAVSLRVFCVAVCTIVFYIRSVTLLPLRLISDHEVRWIQMFCMYKVNS